MTDSVTSTVKSTSVPPNAPRNASTICDAHLGRVPVAGEVHEARHEAAVMVAADEQPHPAPLAHAHDPDGQLGELVDREPEQLVARIGLEHVGERATVVAVGREARAGEHLLRLAPQHRDGLVRLAVHVGGVEPEEALLADDRAVGTEATHADEVERHVAVHRRPFE